MKRPIILIVILMTISATLLFLISCKKNSTQEDEVKKMDVYGDPIAFYAPVDNLSIDYITNPISLKSDPYPFLIFPTRTNFDYTMGELKRLNGMFEVPDSLQDSVAFDPILEKFENKYSGFLSVRKLIMNEIDSLSDANVYNPHIYDPDDHFIGDLYYRTVLNSLLEVQIGETIYKVMSKEWVAEFSSGDPNLLTFARNYDISNLYSTIDDTIVNNIKFYYTGTEYDDETLAGNGIKRASCSAGIEWREVANGLISFIGSPQNSCTMQWDWGDGTTNGTGVIPDHIYAKNGRYIVKVTVSCPLSTCTAASEVVVTTAATTNPCTNPPVADFTVVFPDLGQVQLVSTTNNVNFIYKWEVKPTTETFVEKGVFTFNKSFPKGGTFDFCLTIYDKNGCKSNEKCSTITVVNGCCERGHSQIVEFWDYITDHKMKYKIFRWNGGPLGRNIGAKTVNFEKRFRKFSLRRNPNKHWIRTNAKIWVHLEGDIWVGTRAIEKNYWPCKDKFWISKDEYKSSKYNADVVENPVVGLVIFDAHRIYTKRHRVISSHWILDNGTYYTKYLNLSNCY